RLCIEQRPGPSGGQLVRAEKAEGHDLEPLFRRCIAMDTFVQDVVSALALGSLYAIYALPIALLFGVMRLINFAHGELIMVAGFALYLSRDLGLASILVALVACGAVALLTERVAFRP